MPHEEPDTKDKEKTEINKSDTNNETALLT